MTLSSTPAFRFLTGLYEPSAVQQLTDGRFLVLEDEKARPFSLVTIGPDGTAASVPLRPAPPESAKVFRKLNDLEGIALCRAGHIYAITSHSRDGDGDEKASRERLLRFRIEGDRVVAPMVSKALKPALLAAHPGLAAAAEIRDVKAGGGLNIEALDFSPDARRLLIGFRSPLLGNLALVACVENPAAIFDSGEAPRISARLETLDLGGNGIRGMSWFPCLDGYLVIGGPVAREPVQFQLWFWSGRPGAPARRVTIPGLPGLERAEGICPAVIDGRQWIVVVSDDGNRKEGRFARFLLLEPGQLQVAA
ncbi:MAG: hypothetical protein R3E35_01740 [Rhodocyclaceae bacterium]